MNGTNFQFTLNARRPAQVTFLNLTVEASRLSLAEETYSAEDKHSPRWGNYADVDFADVATAEHAFRAILDSESADIKAALVTCYAHGGTCAKTSEQERGHAIDDFANIEFSDN